MGYPSEVKVFREPFGRDGWGGDGETGLVVLEI